MSVRAEARIPAGVRGAALTAVDVPRIAVVVVAFTAVFAMALAQGAYFASTWGWSALALSWTAVLALVLRSRIRVSMPELVAVGALAALTGWTALSAVWSATTPGSIREVERSMVYVVGVLALIALTPSRAWRTLLGAVSAALVVVCAYALGARLFPESFAQIDDGVGGFRLDEPIGYWNTLGIVAAMGALLGVGFAARATTLPVRAFAAASTVVVLPTLYFTFGRGAWLALAIGLVVLIAFDPRRLHMLAALAVLAPAPAAAVWLASEAGPLSRRGAPIAEVAEEGQRFAIVLLLLAVIAAAAIVVFTLLERRVTVPPGVRYAWGGAVGAGTVAALVAVMAVYGGPVTLADKAYDSFRSAPVSVRLGESGTKRLFTLSSNGRLDLWDAAWSDFREHPVGGSGAGSYEQYWVQHRPWPGVVRDAHGLYVEMLAELGVVGGVLLVVALGLPLVAALRVRDRRLVPAAVAAYVAFLAHAGADWDWEMPVVTFAALVCGVALLVAARPVSWPVRVPWPARGAATAVVLGIAAFSYVSAVGNSAIREAQEALFFEREPTRGLAEAHRATSWAPWSSEAWLWRSRAEFMVGRDEESLESLRIALDKDSRNWELWLDLAYGAEGRHSEEEEGHSADDNPQAHALKVRAMRRVLELNPIGTEIDLAFADEELGLTREEVEAAP